MTRTANARVAGFTYLSYAGIGICGEVLMHEARGTGGEAAILARIGAYAGNVRLLMPGASVPMGSVFFAVGSTVFSWLLLRGRMVPAPIAGLGVAASALLAVTLPLQLAGFSTGPLSGYVQWLPALVFQILVGPWLLVKGVPIAVRGEPA